MPSLLVITLKTIYHLFLILIKRFNCAPQMIVGIVYLRFLTDMNLCHLNYYI